MKKIGLITIFFLLTTTSVKAAPSLYFDEGPETVVDYTHSVGLFIDTAGSNITAFQTIIDLPASYLGFESILMADYPNPEFPNGTKPNCVHSLLPPEWGYSNKSSPYTDTDINKLYISCGFTNPGYNTQGSTGDKLATLTFFADAVGTDSLSFESANTKFYFNGGLVSTGSLSSYTISVLSAIEPTPGPGTIPEKATDSISESDLNFVELGVNGTSQQGVVRSSGEAGDLEVVEQDNTIPEPPADLPERSLPQSLLDRLRGRTSQADDGGEVLSAQSLRELLIPGKSDADKRVVWINLISLLVFLLVVSVLIWSYFRIKRQSKIKSDHLADLLEGELAVIESKLGGAVNNKNFNQELATDLEQIRQDFKK